MAGGSTEKTLKARAAAWGLVFGTAILVMPGAASAAVIAVDTTADASVDDNECSLREAVRSANTNLNVHEDDCEQGGTSQDIINLPAGTFTLSSPLPAEDANLSGDLDYTGGGQLAVQGPANSNGVPSATIDAPAAERIFDIPLPENPPNRGLILSNLTLTDGRALGVGPEGDGGAIRVAVQGLDLDVSSARITGSQAGRNGGAISFDTSNAFGNIVVQNSEFSGNSAGTQTVGGSGGAIWAGVGTNAPLIKNSTLAANDADGVGGAVGIRSGADSPFMTIRNSTLSASSAEAGGSAVGFFQTGGTGSVTLQFSTVAGNTSPFVHGALESTDANHKFFVRGSILAGNIGAGQALNCEGDAQFTTQEYNVESANTCFLSPGSTDLVNTDPLLAPLTISTAPGASQTARTHGLFDGSPAADLVPRTPIDKCGVAVTDDQDQRGIARPVAPNGKCDAGAFEGSVGPKPVTPIVTQPPVVNQPTPPSTTPSCPKGKKPKVVKGKRKCVKKKRKKK